jgi:protocatechuate 3,4-dioxygenase beta subunit
MSLDVAGEHIRKDIKDNQKGVNLHLDIQVVDVNTCQPLKGIAVEIWAANSTVRSTELNAME